MCWVIRSIFKKLIFFHFWQPQIFTGRENILGNLSGAETETPEHRRPWAVLMACFNLGFRCLIMNPNVTEAASNLKFCLFRGASKVQLHTALGICPLEPSLTFPKWLMFYIMLCPELTSIVTFNTQLTPPPGWDYITLSVFLCVLKRSVIIHKWPTAAVPVC